MVSQYSLSGAFVLLLLLRHTLAVAPGDEDAECDSQDYLENIRVLLDSWRYQTLLGTNGSWTALNTDRTNTNTWSSHGECESSTVAVCHGGPGEKFLMTQFINKSLPAPDAYPVRIFINISYTFLPCPRRHCDSDFELEISHTDSEQDSFSKHGIEPDHRLRDTTSNGTKQFFIDFDERMDGFFLALKSKMKGVCVNVSRVFVYRHECPGHDRHNIGLVRRPSTQAPIEGNVSVKSQCAENSNFTDMSMPDLLVCTSNGKWLNDQTQCVCNEGYEQIDNNFNCEKKKLILPTSLTATEMSTLSISPQASTVRLETATQSITASKTQPLPSDLPTNSVGQILTTLVPPTSRPEPTIQSSNSAGEDGVPLVIISVVMGIVVVVIVITLLGLLLFVALTRKGRMKPKESDRNPANPVYDATTQDTLTKVISTTSNGNSSDHKQEEDILYKLYNPLYITPQSADSDKAEPPNNVYFEEPQYSVPDTLRRESNVQYEVPTVNAGSPIQPEDSNEPPHTYDYASVPPHEAPEYAILEGPQHDYHCLESPTLQAPAPAMTRDDGIDGEAERGCETADGNTLCPNSDQSHHLYAAVDHT